MKYPGITILGNRKPCFLGGRSIVVIHPLYRSPPSRMRILTPLFFAFIVKTAAT